MKVGIWCAGAACVIFFGFMALRHDEAKVRLDSSRYACEMVKSHAAGVLYGLQSVVKTSGDMTPEAGRALLMVRAWMAVLSSDRQAQSKICAEVLPKLTREILEKNPGVGADQAAVTAVSIVIQQVMK